MLQFEKTEPSKLVYEEPSDALINFLAKHYGLTRIVSQNSNFIVYSQFFDVIIKF